MSRKRRRLSGAARGNVSWDAGDGPAWSQKICTGKLLEKGFNASPSPQLHVGEIQPVYVTQQNCRAGVLHFLGA